MLSYVISLLVVVVFISLCSVPPSYEVTLDLSFYMRTLYFVIICRNFVFICGTLVVIC